MTSIHVAQEMVGSMILENFSNLNDSIISSILFANTLFFIVEY